MPMSYGYTDPDDDDPFNPLEPEDWDDEEAPDDLDHDNIPDDQEDDDEASVS